MSQPSTKPYLLRAIYEWCVDSGFTPYISVQVDGATRVPLEFVRDGLIVLNVGPSATRNLTMSNDRVEFFTRFNGVSREVSVPVGAITGIFARENGEGLAFQAEARVEGEAVDSVQVSDPPPGDDKPAGASSGTTGAASSGPVGLTLAQVSAPTPPNRSADRIGETPAGAESGRDGKLAGAKPADGQGQAGPDGGPGTPPGGAPPRGRPSLRVIK